MTGFHVYKVNGTTDTEISTAKTMETATDQDDRILINFASMSTDGSEVIAKNGATCTYKFIVFWNPTDEDSSTMPSQKFKITFDYEQNTTNSTLSPLHVVPHTAGSGS